MASITFDALDDFNKSVEELNILVKAASGYKLLKRPEKQSLMLRSTVLFLGTHLECFFESIAEEYLFKIEQLHLPRAIIPERLLMGAVQYHFDENLVAKINKKSLKCRDTLVKLAQIVSCESPVTELKIDTGFRYGKHGANEVQNLFSRLDIDAVFENCTVYIEKESMLSEGPEKEKVDVKAKFNTLTSIRNALIHQYTMPDEDVINNVIGDIELYKHFAERLAQLLSKKIESLEEQNKAA
ncbi:TPA: hypothetical protein I7708_12535 [Vibrio vulnificus]|nr:hypothetical protein [Vibrio vulnificus]